MSISEFFRQADMVALTLCIVFYSWYFANIYKKRKVGSPEEVRQRAIIAIANQNIERPLFDVLKAIHNHSDKLLLTVKRKNKYLDYFVTILTILSMWTIFHDPIIFGIIGMDKSTVPMLLGADTAYILFISFMLLSSFLLRFDWYYWVDFERLKQEHFNSNHNDNIIVTNRMLADNSQNSDEITEVDNSQIDILGSVNSTSSNILLEPECATASPPAEEIGNEKVEILKVLARYEDVDRDVYIGFICSETGLSRTHAQYHLNALNEKDYISVSYFMGGETEYYLSEGGRAFLVENNLI